MIYLIGCVFMYYLFNKVEENIKDLINNIPKWAWYTVKGSFIIGSWVTFIIILIMVIKKLYMHNK